MISMPKSPQDRANEALLRLLAEAAGGGQSKVDALVALAQRTVYVATWTDGGDDFRTLVNSNGQSALPIFTDREKLLDAAGKFGWLAPDGTIPTREVGAREALRHVMAHELAFVVVDIMSAHALEAERTEIEPLLQTRRSDATGPYAAHGRISSTMLRAVKPTPQPQALPGVQPPRDLPGGAFDGERRSRLSIEASRPSTPSVDATPSATFGSGAGAVSIRPLTTAPDEALLDALSDVLRAYPEVEWAAFCAAARGPAPTSPTIGLRVDASYRARVNDIIGDIRETGSAHSATLDVLLLDDPGLVRAARSDAIVFFPWRRRPGA